MTLWRRILLPAVLVLLFSGCTVLPPLPPRAASHALLDWSVTSLGSLSARSLDGQAADVSGFELLKSSAQALDARLTLIDAAERSLDLQYHEFRDDRSGTLVMRALQRAAARGVRVRVLIDDLLTAGEDGVLQGLADHPGIEVRVFNPYAPPRNAGWTRFLSSIGSMDRLTRRMHNKLMVADNAVAINGGRNISDAYLLGAQGGGLIDLDLLSAGPVVRELSDTFDRYWNSELAYPIGVIAMPRLAPAEAQAVYDQELRAHADPDLGARGAVPDALSDQVRQRRLDLVFGVAHAVADSPEKVLAERGTAPFKPVGSVIPLLYATHHEILIATPYLIPGAAGIAAMRQTLERGARITIVTNSLATTDEPIIHQAYSLYRRDLLQAGASIFELSATVSGAGESGDDLPAQGQLQSRITVVDRARVYLGSMNLDGRSARANTELGLSIESPALAGQLMDMFTRQHRDDMYQVRLTPDRRDIEWVGRRNGVETIYTREPESSWYARTRLWLSSPFISEDLL